MKKLIIVLVLLLAATALFGQAIKLGTFPSAKWLDAPPKGEYDYQAVWEFSPNNIKVSDVKTGETFDFSANTVKDFKVTDEGGVQTGISFSCVETGKSYFFKTNLPNTDITMEITRSDGTKYNATMKKQ